MPTDTKTIGFSDNLAVVFLAKYLEAVKEMTNNFIVTIPQYLSMRDLKLADHKTEPVFVNSHECHTIPKIWYAVVLVLFSSLVIMAVIITDIHSRVFICECTVESSGALC